MTFKQKRKRYKQNNWKLLFIDFRDEDLKKYSPEECQGLEEAFDRFEKDITRLARMNGFHRNMVWQDNIEEAKEKIYKLWEDYYGTNEETRAQ